jgi:hypothetical protein
VWFVADLALRAPSAAAFSGELYAALESCSELPSCSWSAGLQESSVIVLWTLSKATFSSCTVHDIVLKFKKNILNFMRFFS